MKFILSLAGFVLAACAAPTVTISPAINLAFQKYYKTYNKAALYKEGSEEYFHRMGVFAKNVARVNELNAKHVLASKNGEAVHGINKFTDMTKEEFTNMYLNPMMANTTADFENHGGPRMFMPAPKGGDIDWRDQGVVTPVKDQAQCGSCWAFSATEAIESFAKQAGQDLAVLSPQQIVSCDTADAGCGGGWPYKAYEYVQGAGGMETDSDYPYTSGGGDSGQCKFDSSKIVPGIQVTGYTKVMKGETHLASALEKGPVSIAVDASSWSSYSGGVLSECGTSVDHAVQLVGMTADYWIVRNSWGTSWGEQGFIRIARGSDLCLISDYVTYPHF